MGAETLTPDPVTGLLTGTAVGDVTSTMGYNAFGEPDALSYGYQGAPVYEVSYDRDAVGRIIARTDDRDGVVSTRCYEYDPAGRLTKVHSGYDPLTESCTGTLVEEYRYDGNSNRIYASNSAGIVDGDIGTDVLVDDQDRLLEYGALQMTYTANGELDVVTDTGSGEARPPAPAWHTREP